MIAWSMSLLFAGLSVAEAPDATFDHRRFCEIMQVVASLPSTQPGTRIQRNIQHGGVLVNCEDHAVEIHTVLSYDQSKAHGQGVADSTEAVLARRWVIAHGWSLKAVILVGSNEAASFTVSCAGD